VTAMLEGVPSIVAEWLGAVHDRGEATRLSLGLPKEGFVAPLSALDTSSGPRVKVADFRLSARLRSMQTAHRSYTGTGARCAAVAWLIEPKPLPDGKDRTGTLMALRPPYGAPLRWHGATMVRRGTDGDEQGGSDVIEA
jgi:2-methylaconitate cis-trans-isomerase PrpF